MGEETPAKQLSSTKKRLFSELPADAFKPPTDDRFNSMIEGIHNDELKEPLTLKRAPLNHEILEELELIRLDYKGKAEEAKATEYEKAINFLKELNQPIFDAQDMQELPNISPEVKLKVQEYLARGKVDDLQLLHRDIPSLYKRDKREDTDNPAEVYMEGFKSCTDVMRNLDVLTQEQRKVLMLYEEDLKQPISREEAMLITDKIKQTLADMFDGAEKVFDIEACGGYRRGEESLSEVDILITRKDGGPTKYLLLKLLETLEDEGVIVQQIKEIRVTSTGSVGFQGVCRLSPAH